jgi:hypothetical protein
MPVAGMGCSSDKGVEVRDSASVVRREARLVADVFERTRPDYRRLPHISDGDCGPLDDCRRNRCNDET